MKSIYIAGTAMLAIAAAFATVGTRSASQPWRTSHFENVLGTSMEIRLIASSPEAANRAETAAMAEIKRLNGILSGYDATSDFSRWTRTHNQPIHVSPELLEALQLWDTWRDRTGGALNPAAETISRIWKDAEAGNKLPGIAQLAFAAQLVQAKPWALDTAAGTATHLTQTPLMLNSFTKSYVIEHAATAAMRTPGVSAIVLNIGGDLVVRGPGSEMVNITDPLASAENSEPIGTLRISDRAVATSGNYRRGFEIGGRHYSHIVDPRTGQTAGAIAGATVVAPHAVDAGALATALCVLTPAESRRLAGTVPGAEYLLVSSDGSRYASAGWSAFEAPAPKAVKLFAQAAPQRKTMPAVSADSNLWNPAMELNIEIEIPQAKGFGARRPYVAVWIEDKDRFPVRTLAVWFQKARWLNELRAWYRDDRLRAMSEGDEILSSVTSATRSPGKYAFKWDGKDNAGKLVKAGRYTVLIEAAREHGGYSLLRREIDFNGQPSQAQLPADVEMGAVALDYRKVARQR